MFFVCFWGERSLILNIGCIRKNVHETKVLKTQQAATIKAEWPPLAPFKIDLIHLLSRPETGQIDVMILLQ